MKTCIDFASYEVKAANKGDTWTLASTNGPDLEMSWEDSNGSAVFSLEQWHAMSMKGFDADLSLELCKSRILVVTLAEFDLLDGIEPMEAGKAILDAAKEAARIRTIWKHGDETEMETVIKALAAVCGSPMKHSGRTKGVPGNIDPTDKAMDWCWQVADDIEAWFNPITEEPHQEERHGALRLGHPVYSQRIYEKPRVEITAHERLAHLETIQGFYDKAASFLGLSAEGVAFRMKTLGEGPAGGDQ